MLFCQSTTYLMDAFLQGVILILPGALPGYSIAFQKRAHLGAILGYVTTRGLPALSRDKSLLHINNNVYGRMMGD